MSVCFLPHVEVSVEGLLKQAYVDGRIDLQQLEADYEIYLKDGKLPPYLFGDLPVFEPFETETVYK